MLFFLFAFVYLLIAYIVAVLLRWKVRGIKDPLNFNFSRKKYYVGMSMFLLAAISEALVLRDSFHLINYLVFGVTGILGEIFFVAWWHFFYHKPIWEYSTDVILKGYSSYLNFLAWGVGGKMLIFVLNLTGLKILLSRSGTPSFNLELIYGIGVVVSVILLCVFIKYIYSKRTRSGFRFTNVTLQNYSFFCLPMITGLVVFTTASTPEFMILFVVYAVVSFLAEYLFGKTVVIVLSKKLWVYNYHPIDNNHTTLLNIIPFGFAAFFFMLVYSITVTLFRS